MFRVLSLVNESLILAEKMVELLELLYIFLVINLLRPTVDIANSIDWNDNDHLLSTCGGGILLRRNPQRLKDPFCLSRADLETNQATSQPP